jgi:hypothetical protein
MNTTRGRKRDSEGTAQGRAVGWAVKRGRKRKEGYLLLLLVNDGRDEGDVLLLGLLVDGGVGKGVGGGPAEGRGRLAVGGGSGRGEFEGVGDGEGGAPNGVCRRGEGRNFFSRSRRE